MTPVAQCVLSNSRLLTSVRCGKIPLLSWAFVLCCLFLCCYFFKSLVSRSCVCAQLSVLSMSAAVLVSSDNCFSPQTAHLLAE